MRRTLRRFTLSQGWGSAAFGIIAKFGQFRNGKRFRRRSLQIRIFDLTVRKMGDTLFYHLTCLRFESGIFVAPYGVQLYMAPYGVQGFRYTIDTQGDGRYISSSPFFMEIY